MRVGLTDQVPIDHGGIVGALARFAARSIGVGPAAVLAHGRDTGLQN